MFAPAVFRMRTLATVLIALALIGPDASGSRVAENHLANVEVLIVRHAERDGALDKLTPAGRARATAYAHYFKNLNLNGRSIRLTHLFAEQSERTRRTLDPLSKAIGLPLDTRFETDQDEDLARDLKTHSYGREILICWHHSRMADLIRALGGDPASVIPNGKWPKATYDWVLDLRFDASGKLSPANEKLIHEHLMPADSPQTFRRLAARSPG